MANEQAKPSTLNRIRTIAKTLEIAKGDIKLLIKAAIDGERSEWRPSIESLDRKSASYHDRCPIRTQQYC